MALKKNNPGCNCCECPDCLLCDDGRPDNIPVTFSATNNACDCSDLNGTFVLAYSECESTLSGGIYTDYCVWRLDTTMLCSGGDSRDVEFFLFLSRYTDFLGRVAHRFYLTVTVENTPSDDRYEYIKDFPYGAGDVNCADTQTMTRNFYIGYLCTPAATCTLNA